MLLNDSREVRNTGEGSGYVESPGNVEGPGEVGGKGSGDVESPGNTKGPGNVKGLFESPGEVGDLLVPDPKATEALKISFFENEDSITSWLVRLEGNWLDLKSASAEAKTKLISRHCSTLKKLLLATKNRNEPRNVPYLYGPIRRIYDRFVEFLKSERASTSSTFEHIKLAWEDAGVDDSQRRDVFDDNEKSFETLYLFAYSALELEVIKEADFEPYKEIKNAWRREYSFPDPVMKQKGYSDYMMSLMSTYD
ncbi:hypothetical protein C8R42DRAFT_661326 [Lentinula raphanica]|nr:hypothetical protein C8R42DRAFT_661326 [Lentinula raphanica]